MSMHLLAFTWLGCSHSNFCVWTHWLVKKSTSTANKNITHCQSIQFVWSEQTVFYSTASNDYYITDQRTLCSTWRLIRIKGPNSSNVLISLLMLSLCYLLVCANTEYVTVEQIVSVLTFHIPFVQLLCNSVLALITVVKAPRQRCCEIVLIVVRLFFQIINPASSFWSIFIAILESSFIYSFMYTLH